MELLDWVVVSAYAVAVLLIGWRVGRGHQTEEELFLGGRRVPAWAAFLSMVATELSAATYIAVPAAAFGGTWSYMQFAFGALIGKFVLATWFISRYHKMKLVTVYGFLEHRFGRKVELLSAWMFLVGRIIASGSRLFIGAFAFAAVTGFEMHNAIIVAGLVAGTYTLCGGIRAVIWTDTIQGAVFVIGAVTALMVLAGADPDGLGGIWSKASDAGKLEVFSLPDIFGEDGWEVFRAQWLAGGSGFVVALLGGFFLNLATHGTDQDMVQRLLTTRDGRRGGLALIGSSLSNFPLTALFLLVGSGLWVFYGQDVAAFFARAKLQDPGHVLPYFVLNEVPAGLRGLIFAGLFAAAMSSMDSAVNAIATTWVVNIRRIRNDAAASVKATRVATTVCALCLIGAALGCAQWRGLLKGSGITLIGFALASMTILYGGLLGAFLVGMMTRRGSQATVLTGMIVSSGVGLMLAIQPLWTPDRSVIIGWPWWIIIGTIISFGIGVTGRPDRTHD